MKNFRRISLILAIMLVMISIAACGNNQQNNGDNNTGVEEAPELMPEDGEIPLETEDDFGNKVTLEEAPERIISLAPSNTEILFALGLGEKVVGVTSFDNYPEEALEKEKIGDYEGINLEKIIELEPDLVINYGESNKEEIERLEEAGIPVLSYLPESIDEVINTIKSIGKITDTIEEANTLTDNMIEKQNQIEDKIKDTESIKVFYEIWHDPLQAAGPGSFMDELITLAGGENIAKDAEGAYAEYDLEQLIERDPEVYLAADDGQKTVEDIIERPGYEEITAIKEKNIHLLDEDISSRPGPRIVDALELVAKAIHPEAFN